VKALYTWYNDVKCNAVYDCNRPGSTGDSQSFNASRTTAAVVSTMTGDPVGGGDVSGGTSASDESDHIALGVGIGIGVPSLIAAIAAV